MVCFNLFLVQVSSALLRLRQRNTYHGQTQTAWSKSIASPGGHLSSLDLVAHQPKESASHVAEIVGTSRIKAQKMVDAAVQVRKVQFCFCRGSLFCRYLLYDIA